MEVLQKLFEQKPSCRTPMLVIKQLIGVEYLWLWHFMINACDNVRKYDCYCTGSVSNMFKLNWGPFLIHPGGEANLHIKMTIYSHLRLLPHMHVLSCDKSVIKQCICVCVSMCMWVFLSVCWLKMLQVGYTICWINKFVSLLFKPTSLQKLLYSFPIQATVVYHCTSLTVFVWRLVQWMNLETTPLDSANCVSIDTFKSLPLHYSQDLFFKQEYALSVITPIGTSPKVLRWNCRYMETVN